MKKIPTIFKRNYETHFVYNEITPGCEWVFQSEGLPTIKIDGTPCLITKDNINGFHLYKRYDAKNGRKPPEHFMPCEPYPDRITGHWPGWVPIKGIAVNEDKPFWEAYDLLDLDMFDNKGAITFELIGLKIQGNPYNLPNHRFIRHGAIRGIPNLKSFDEIKNYLENMKEEGIVWHHPDNRMAKIKRRDFGFEWPIKNKSTD